MSSKFLVTIAEYKEQLVPDYVGNPLIEALPPITSLEETLNSLKFYPSYMDEERTLSSVHRVHCVMRLKRFIQPVEKYVQLERNISLAIRQGYIARNPLDNFHVQRLIRGNEAIKNNLECFELSDNIPSSGEGFSVIGISGIGKTTAIKRILSLYPQVIIHSKYKEKGLSFTQITHLVLECPHEGNIKGLCTQFFKEIDTLLGTNYLVKYGKLTESKMMLYMHQVSINHSLGILVIDEIQHLSIAKSGGEEKMLNFFVTLVNKVGVPIVLIGTPKRLAKIQSQFRQARRSAGIGIIEWDRMTKDMNWNFIINTMWKYQWTNKKNVLTDELSDTIFEESQGITDIAIKLYMLAQIRVIGTKNETITSKVIRDIAKNELKPLNKFLNALKTNDKEVLIEIEDIDLKTNKVKYFAEKRIGELNNLEKYQEIMEAMDEGVIRDVKHDLIQRLLSVGIEAKRAEKISERVLNQYGHNAPILDLVQKACQVAFDIQPTEPQPKYPKLKKNKSKKSGLLIDLAIIAKKENSPVYEVLKEKGLIKIHTFNLSNCDEILF